MFSPGKKKTIMKFVFLTSLLCLLLHAIHGDVVLDDVMARMDALTQEQRAMKSEIAELRSQVEGQCSSVIGKKKSGMLVMLRNQKSGRYASYWNAFLFHSCFAKLKNCVSIPLRVSYEILDSPLNTVKTYDN